jgi:hypothetical protein
MKKILIFLFVLSSMGAIQAQSGVFKVNPLGLAFGVANAGYEFETKEGQSTSISALYYNVSDISGFGIGAEHRFYFDGESLRGWHAGPSVGYLNLTDDSDTRASAFSIGAEVGHQWIFDSGFAVDVFGGIGFVVGGSELSGFNSTAVGIGVSLGYAW